MQDKWDVVVLGAGPAGGAAARVAAGRGVRVLLLDEQKFPGGQVWRAYTGPEQHKNSSIESRAGDRFRTMLAQSNVSFSGECRVWHVEKDSEGWRLHVLGPTGISQVSTASLVLAPGAREFVQPFPGWTTPGVFGLAGVTALMKSQQIAPGRRCIVAGSGPLAIYAGYEILRLGGDVAAIVTPNSRIDWMKCVPALLSNPSLATRGAYWTAQIKRAGVPILWRHLVTRADGEDTLSTVHISSCTANWAPSGETLELQADALCIGNGLVPNTDVAALAGVELRFDASIGGWVAPSDWKGQTVIPGLYICGDGAQLRGAAVASKQGEVVGKTTADYLQGASSGAGSRKNLRLDRTVWLGRTMTLLSHPRSGLQELATPDTIVCRCENLSRATLEAKVDAGAMSVQALKSETRCAMGACGGRYCITNIVRLLETRLGVVPGSIEQSTPRPPLFPLPIAAISKDFDYDNLPLPALSPL